MTSPPKVSRYHAICMPLRPPITGHMHLPDPSLDIPANLLLPTCHLKIFQLSFIHQQASHWFLATCSWMTNKLEKVEIVEGTKLPPYLQCTKSPFFEGIPIKLTIALKVDTHPLRQVESIEHFLFFCVWRRDLCTCNVYVYIYRLIKVGVGRYNEDDIFIIVDTVFYSKPFGWCRRTNLPPFFRNKSQAAVKGERRTRERRQLVSAEGRCWITFIFGLYEVSPPPPWPFAGSISNIFNRRKIACIWAGFDDFWRHNVQLAGESVGFWFLFDALLQWRMN